MTTRKWTEHEDAYLAANFADAEMWRMVDETSRSRFSIYYRAKVLGLKRTNQTLFKPGKAPAGTPFSKGNVPWNAGTKKDRTGLPIKGKTPLRDKIIAMLLVYGNQTVAQLATAAGAKQKAVWAACDKMRKSKEIHIGAYIPAPGKHAILYALGAGEDALCPERKSQADLNEPDPYEPVPVPRPQLGAWGLCWNITTSGDAANTQELVI